MIAVERGIPVPQEDRRNKYPWKQMEVGDSFFVADKSVERMYRQSWAASKEYGRKFRVSAVDGGVRVWRIA